jgi:hypothetical protein
MFIYYKKKTGEIKLMSETEQDLDDSFDFIEKELIDEDIEEIQNIQFEKRIKDNKLIVDKSRSIQKVKEDKIKKLSKITDIEELKDFIINNII